MRETRLIMAPRYYRDVLAACAALILFSGTIGCVGCNDGTTGSTRSGSPRNDLSAMEKARLTIDEHAFETWLARTPRQQELGLMQVEAEELKPLESDADDENGIEAEAAPIHRGMLFIFDRERILSFWMFNTITPLDIAYIAADGRIVKTHTMAPLETRHYSSVEPAKYALEVLAGTFERLGITEGDMVEIPESVLKDEP